MNEVQVFNFEANEVQTVIIMMKFGLLEKMWLKRWDIRIQEMHWENISILKTKIPS